MRIPLFILAVTSTLALAACKHDDASAAATGDGGTAPAASAASTATGSVLGAGFEGDITMHITAARGPEDITFVTKGGKLRVDTPARNGQTAHVIFDPQSNKTLVILDAQKMYMEMEKPMAAAAVAQGAKTPPALVKTGKHETIAGTDCEDWTSDSDGKHVALCVAHGIGFFDFAAMGPGAGPASAWIEELKRQQFFPLRAVDTDSSGKETSRMEVTKIEKKAIDDSLFAIPAGYHEMTIPHGMPGMPGGMPPGMPAGMPGMNR